MAKAFKNFEEYAAAKAGGKVPAIGESDPNRKFYVVGHFHTGEIVEYEGEAGKPARALPTLLFVDHLETARVRVREGWLPVEHVRDEVLDLLLAFHGGADKLPAPVAAQLKDRLEARALKGKKAPATT